MTQSPPARQRSSDRWLTAARVAWALVTLLSLAAFFFAIPPRYAQLLSPEEEIRDGLAQSGYSEAYIEQAGTEAAIREAVAPLGLSPEGYASLFLGLEAASALVYVAVGLVIAWRKFDDRFGLFASAFLITFGIGGSSYILLPLTFQRPAGFLLGSLVTMAAYSLMPAFFYLFPDGRWVPRWGWALAAFWAFTTYFWNFEPRSPLNPTGWPVWLYFLYLILIWGSVAVAQVVRYWKISTLSQRQQTKWLVGGFGLMVAVLVTPAIFVPLLFPTVATETFYSLLLPFQVVVFAVIPIALGIGILRYRLWDIDLLIRRTLQYSLLSGLLALTYFGLITLLQSLFRSLSNQQSEISIVLSTLAIAALFFPLRQRVQVFIDKRFFRKKYDAQKVLAEFAATCRDETDLEKLTARLGEVAGETMQPESLSVWLRKTEPLKHRQ